MLEFSIKLFGMCLLTLVLLSLAAYVVPKFDENTKPGQLITTAVLCIALLGIAAGDLAVWLL